MLSSYFSNIRRTRFDQSSPVQHVSESRGGSTSVTNKRTEKKEILVSNFGCMEWCGRVGQWGDLGLPWDFPGCFYCLILGHTTGKATRHRIFFFILQTIY